MSNEAEHECAILERIFLSIVMADTDEQFQQSLNKFLTHILKKASSPHEPVRTKVVEVLSHISKRVKATKNITLPVETLLDIYEQPNASVFLINFSIIYIKMGFPRLPLETKRQLLPRLIKATDNRPISHQESLCLLLLANLKKYPYPKEDKERANIFDILRRPPIKKLILDIVMDIFLFPYGCVGERNLTDISLYSYKRLVRDDFFELNADAVEQLKLSMVQFIGIIGSSDVYPHLVVASSDARCSVSEAAESQLKLLPEINYDDILTATPLYSLYLRHGQGETSVNTLNARIRLKLLQHLAKFRVIMWPGAMKVLFESLYGAYTNPKLKTHALNFGASLIKYLPQEQLDQIWPVLLNSALMKLLREEKDRKNKIQAYQLLSTLVLRSPSISKKNLSPVEFIFQAIEAEDDPDLRSAARDCAASMAKGYKGVDSTQEVFLYSLLETKLFPVTGSQGGLQSATGQQLEGLRASRSAAVRFVGDALQHSPLKVYTLLKAVILGDEDSCAEAKKALYLTRRPKGSTKEELASGLVPFDTLLTLILSKPEMNQHTVSVIKEIVSYLRLCLAKDAGLSDGLEPVSHPSEGSYLIQQKLLEYHNADPALLPSYLSMLVNTIQAEPEVICLSAVLELVGCLPDVLATHMLEKLQSFLELSMSHAREEVRYQAAEIASLLIPSDAAPRAMNTAVENIRTGGKNIEKIHGSIAIVGFIAARHGGATKKAVAAVDDFLKHGTLNFVAVTSIGNMAQSQPLPIDKDNLEQLVNKLLEMLLEQKMPSKVKDRICLSLSNFCAAELDFPFKDLIITKLLESVRQVKDVDTCLSTGEALSTAVLGKASILVINPWNRNSVAEEAHKEQLVGGGSLAIEAEKACIALDTVLDKVLKSLIEDRHPHTRQALCFWLLALTKHCGFLPSAEKRLSDIQNGFIDLLSDSNSLVQEGAGKGLTLVYEATPEEEAKSALLKTVVEQLTIGRRSVVKISDDTKLFQTDELGSTPTGDQLSTYKELCQLASELNQPDLIYKFMDLANHNSVWNSKKGAAYTISNLLAKTNTNLDGQLPKVLTKLYRYQYDPVPHIQQSMAGVWASLASPDSVQKYYYEIFNDLLNNLTAVHWRVRISCCLAVQDFIRGPEGSKIVEVNKLGGLKTSLTVLNTHHPEKIGELWTQLIRVMDDIHERTRNAASSSAKSLSKLCIRETKKENGKIGQALAAIVLKILLQVGILSTVSEIRAVSISTIADIVKEGLPKAEAPNIILSLLKSCADLDLANIYVAGNVATEALDKIRIPMLKCNNIVQALLACIPHLDVDMIDGLHSDLVDLLKPSAGFGTRIITSHFIVLASHHLTKEQLQPYVGKFLGCFLSGLSDRSPGIRRQYASSMGQLIRTAKESSVEKLLEKLRSLYFEKDDEGVRKAICQTLQAICNHSQDSVKDKEDLILPLVFFAKHLEKLPDGSNENEVEDWNEVWNDLAFTNSALVAYEDVVVTLLETAIGSQSWKIKAQMARASKTLGQREELSNSKRLTLTSLIVNALPGRTWDGKEHLLNALAALAKYPQAILGTEIESQLVECLIKECMKERTSYKKFAFNALGEVIESLDTDRFQLVYPMLKEIMTNDECSMDNGDKEDREQFDSRFVLLETSYDTLARCWPKNISTQGRFIEEIIGNCLLKLEISTPQVQTAIVSCLSKIISKSKEMLRGDNSVQIVKIADALIKVMDHCFSLPKNTKLKKEALNLLQTLQLTFKGRNQKEYDRLFNLFTKFNVSLSKESAPEVKSRFVDIKEMFRTETMMS